MPAMAYIDHNRRNHINNACTSWEAATCLMAVKDIQKIGTIQDAQNICSWQAYAFYYLHFLCSYAVADRSPHAKRCRAVCMTSRFFFSCSLIAKMKVLEQ